MAQVMTVRSQCFAVKPPRPKTFCPIHHPFSYLKFAGWASRPGPYDMNWPPPAGAHLLAPFDHQVAGQSSMLRYDESTVCKPLITREHFVYQTLPECLREFTAEYRGELEVGLAEKDGYLQLYGLCVKDDSNEDLCQCSLQQGNIGWEDTTTLDVSKLGSGYPSTTINIASDVGDQSRCVIRVLRSGSYEMCSLPSDNPVLINSKDNTEALQTPSLNPWSLKNHKRLLDKMRKGKHRHNSFRCILLKNVVADFKNPCILDLKIGSRLHGDEARPYKVENQTKKCAETTSSTLGVRLCGMQVFQVNTGLNINLDKYEGRLLTDKTFRETLVRFLHNGMRYRSELLQPIVNKLSSLINCLSTVKTYRFYASSLLIIYDGLEGGMDKVPDQDMSWYCSDQVNGTFLSTTPYREQKQTVNGHVEMHADVLKNHPVNDEGRLKPHQSSSLPHSNVHSSMAYESPNQTADGSNCSLSRSSDSKNDVDSGIRSSLHTYPPSSPHSSQTHSENVTHSQTLKHSYSQSHTAMQIGLLNHSSLSGNNSSSSKHITSPSSSSSLQISKRDTASVQDCKVDVKMIDFAHTTHQGFPNDPCRHEGPDMDYIQGLTNLKTLFENLMTER